MASIIQDLVWCSEGAFQVVPFLTLDSCFVACQGSHWNGISHPFGENYLCWDDWTVVSVKLNVEVVPFDQCINRQTLVIICLETFCCNHEWNLA